MKDWFSKLLPQLHTGDVILTSTPRGKFGTDINRCMSHSRTTHIGLVYRPSDSPTILKHKDRHFPDKVDASRPLLLQMLGGGTVGHREQGKEEFKRGGMEIVDLETYLKDYLDKFSYYEHPLEKEPCIVGVRMLSGFTRDVTFYTQVEDIVTEHWNKPFQHDVGNVKIQIDCCQTLCYCCPSTLSCCHAKDDSNSFICSELVAQVYVKTGLLKKDLCGNDLNPGEFVPVHWDSSRRLRLLSGVSLSKEYLIVGPRSVEERAAMGYQKLQSEITNLSIANGPGGWWGVDTQAPVPNEVHAPEQLTMDAKRQDLRKVACEPTELA